MFWDILNYVGSLSFKWEALAFGAAAFAGRQGWSWRTAAMFGAMIGAAVAAVKLHKMGWFDQPRFDSPDFYFYVSVSPLFLAATAAAAFFFRRWAKDRF